jgi:hypothetical protein
LAVFKFVLQFEYNFELINQAADYIKTPPFLAMKPPKTREVMAESLIRMLIEGPAVSFKGSPIVSAITAASCS